MNATGQGQGKKQGGHKPFHKQLFVDQGRPARVGKHGAHEVQVSFHFDSEEAIPEIVQISFRKGSRMSDVENDKMRARQLEQMGNKHLAEVGAVRPGRVDGGHPAIQNLPACNLSGLRVALANAGALLVDAFWFAKPDGKAVVRLVYLQDAPTSDILQITTSTLETAIRDLCKLTAVYCHVFDNAMAGYDTVTINQIVGATTPLEARHTLTVSDGKIIVQKHVA